MKNSVSTTDLDDFESQSTPSERGAMGLRKKDTKAVVVDKKARKVNRTFLDHLIVKAYYCCYNCGNACTATQKF